MDAHEYCWYVAYGSNLCRARFDLYLAKTAPIVAPLDSRAVWLHHRLFFARHSERWGGGAAFVDPARGAATTRGRAWLLERRQFLSVLANENARTEIDVPAAIWSLEPGARVEVEGGWYRVVVACDPIDGIPALTFTTPRPLPEPTVPGLAYVDTIARGLAESHGLGRPDALAYLAEHGAEEF